MSLPPHAQVAVFIFYPGWASSALSIFACSRVDSGQGLFADRQQATWPYGYWLRDMNQKCYTGVHLYFWVPLGVVCVAAMCFAPPLASWAVLWSHRHALDTPSVVNRFGFLYDRYRPKYYWWESLLVLQVRAFLS